MSKEGIEIDPLPIIIGIWHRKIEKVKSKRDFGIFYIYENWGYDEEGTSYIKIERLDDKEIKFDKAYDPRGNTSGMEFKYEGKSEDGKIYRGKWFDKEQEGDFILTRVNKKVVSEDISEIEKIVGQFEHRVFYAELINKRRRFVYLPLRQALKD